MEQKTIKTYGVESFLSRFTQPTKKAGDLLKAGWEQFFIVRVEDMFQTMRLPVPPTRATIHTIIYLTDGQATMHIGSEMYQIGPGECLIVPAGQVFSFDRDERNKGYQCSFLSDFLAGKYANQDLFKTFDFLRVWGSPEVHLGQPASVFVEQLLNRLLCEYSENGLAHPDLIQPYLLALLAEINQVYQADLACVAQRTAHLSNRFRALIFDRIKTMHQVTEYAALLNVSPNHLNKVVKSATGKSPTKWIDEAIVLEAKVLLHQTDYSINQVATEIGILDPSYFSRLFKKHVGTTPLEFRKMIEKS